MSMTPPNVDAPFRTLVIIAAGLVLSLVVYAAVVEAFARGLVPFRSPAVPLPDAARWVVLAIAAGFALVASRWIRRSALDARPGLESFRSGTIAALATAESAAVIGFVWFLVTGRRGEFYVCLACAVIGFVINWPRRADWDDVARGHADSRRVR